jgi:hypothetical protein
MSVLKNISMKVLPAGVSKHFVTAGQPLMPQNPHRTGSQNICQNAFIDKTQEPQQSCIIEFLASKFTN